MQKTINKIISIERSAQNVVAEAERKRNTLSESVRTELEEIRKTEMADADRILSREEAEATARLQQAMQKNALQHDRDMEALRLAFAQNGDAWADKIFRACIRADR
jgi:F0F1-type ATP synthase membrane subunit b/b'